MVFTANELIIVPKERAAPVEVSAIPEYSAVGITPEMDLVFDTDTGYLFSRDLGASWGGGTLVSVRWLESETQATTPELAQRYGEALISWERWLQDLHSGRFFGPVGIWVMSLAALIFIVLAFTGLLVWLSTLKRR